MFFEPPLPYAVPRRVQMPLYESEGVACRPKVSTLVDALATFIMRARDVMDFGIDFSDWLKSNADSVIKTAVWSEASGSPQSPTLGSSVLFPGTETVVMVGPGTANDVYWLDCTVTIATSQQRENQALAIPERTIVRRVAIKVLAG